ncbi:hypothetical protein COCMIDRAFT_28168 [Bipolaris oryzae ATCC 44560]|uniref:EF-hand domain-containing protein n=1 Tax=Bipolaris oryzae ATCC 44560 TaxID=930090 RepID=W6Z0A7_COCMI|nr:uncharacterized protein COCMIDRAFT_28168 [Bipolaris oryzae ATCC 44560]EUC43330.1 hypothetical protein COCMIDRAFT_28168 [Bipolaris oryzae ATCC 44560]
MRTQVLFAMSLVAWGSSSVMCRISDSTCDERWIMVLRKVLLATIPAAAIFYAEDILMECIITHQAKRIYKKRNLDEIMRQNQFTTCTGPRLLASTSVTRLLSITVKFFEALFLRNRPDPNNEHNQSKRYILGKGSDKEFDRHGKPFLETFVEQRLPGEDMSFTQEFLKKKLDEGIGKVIDSGLLLMEKGFTAAEIMKMMDKDDSGVITRDEVAELLKELIMAMRDINKSVNGMRRAARSANAVVCFLLLFVVAIIYAGFFVKNLTSYLTPISITITGLSFALGGAVTEFITACQFVFSKQPYNVGDRVIIEEKELIVEKVCLLYTVFNRCSDCAVEQIAHKKICDAWITNLTRSKGLIIKEVASIADKMGIFTSDQLEAHEKDLVDFTNKETVRKSYLDAGGVKVSLHAEQQQLVANIKLNEIMVRHEKVLSRMRGQIRDWLERLVREGGGQVSVKVEPTTSIEPTIKTQ